MKRGGIKREGEILKREGGGVITERGLFERGA